MNFSLIVISCAMCLYGLGAQIIDNIINKF